MGRDRGIDDHAPPPAPPARAAGTREIAVVLDLGTFRRVEGPGDGEPSELEGMIEGWLVRAAGKPSRGYVAVGGIATLGWADDGGFENKAAFIQPAISAIASAAMSDLADSPDTGGGPLIDDEFGKVWARSFYDTSLDSIMIKVYSFINNVNRHTGQGGPLALSEESDEGGAEATDYGSLVATLRKEMHQHRLSVAERLAPALNIELSTMESGTLEGKKALCDFVASELGPLGLAVECPDTKLPAKFKATTGHTLGVGRFYFEVYLDGKRKQTAVSETLPRLNLVDATPSIESETPTKSEVRPDWKARAEKSGDVRARDKSRL